MMKTLKRYIKYINIQKLIINNFNWKYLIILDACRYDYFKRNWLYSKVFKVKSPASYTLEWLKIVFPNFYNCLLFSCNPFIGNKRFKNWDYNAFQHFRKVICLWLNQWDKRFSTVLPEVVYRYCVKHALPKSIIWFLQPHLPYIDLEIKKTYEDFRNWNPKLNIIDWSENNNNKYTTEQIRVLYENNLKIVIPYVYKLTQILEKPIIITSDHGELLGEYGLIGHPNIKKKELRDVPLVLIK